MFNFSDVKICFATDFSNYQLLSLRISSGNSSLLIRRGKKHLDESEKLYGTSKCSKYTGLQLGIRAFLNRYSLLPCTFIQCGRIDFGNNITVRVMLQSNRITEMLEMLMIIIKYAFYIARLCSNHLPCTTFVITPILDTVLQISKQRHLTKTPRYKTEIRD